MKKCKAYNCENTNIVYSGIDSLVLGVPSETYCYSCSYIYAQIKRDVDLLVKS